MEVNSATQEWVDVYEGYRKSLESSKTDLDKNYWKAQIKQIEPTLDALGIKKTTNYSSEYTPDSSFKDSDSKPLVEDTHGDFGLSNKRSLPGYDSSSGSFQDGFDTRPQTEPLTDAQTKERANRWVHQIEKDLHVTHEQAVGIVANLCHESWGLNPAIQQGGQLGGIGKLNKGVNQSGYGICQWGEGRQKALEQYAAQNGLDPASEAAQYGYFIKEVQGSESASIEAVRKTSTAEEAMMAFCNGFERPSEPLFEERRNWIGAEGVKVPISRPYAIGTSALTVWP